MRRNTKLDVEYILSSPMGGETPLWAGKLPFDHLFSLEDGEKVPPPTEWARLLEHPRDSFDQPIELTMTVTYDNPAHDSFPGTISILPDLEPAPKKALRVTYRLEPTYRLCHEVIDVGKEEES